MKDAQLDGYEFSHLSSQNAFDCRKRMLRCLPTKDFSCRSRLIARYCAKLAMDFEGFSRIEHFKPDRKRRVGFWSKRKMRGRGTYQGIVPEWGKKQTCDTDHKFSELLPPPPRNGQLLKCNLVVSECVFAYYRYTS